MLRLVHVVSPSVLHVSERGLPEGYVYITGGGGGGIDRLF
jgi:hypothetical protein